MRGLLDFAEVPNGDMILFNLAHPGLFLKQLIFMNTPYNIHFACNFGYYLYKVSRQFYFVFLLDCTAYVLDMYRHGKVSWMVDIGLRLAVVLAVYLVVATATARQLPSYKFWHPALKQQL